MLKSNRAKTLYSCLLYHSTTEAFSSVHAHNHAPRAFTLYSALAAH